ncbi:MAG: phosphoglycerate kinase [Candidatus Micrarchaeota archaeon]|nr:phosphoglycerate kinase [Candidatus Micrarchaeota archaeon]
MSRRKALVTALEQLDTANYDLTGKKVLMRVDINSPVKDGILTNTDKIKAIVPDIKGAIPYCEGLVLVSHQGRMGGKDFISLEQHVDVLRKELPTVKIKYTRFTSGPNAERSIRELQPGEILVLENIRMDEDEKREGTIAERAGFPMTRSLASAVDIVVFNSFAAWQNDDTSLTGLPQVRPTLVGGYTIKEARLLESLDGESDKKLSFIIGGGKPEKMKYIPGLIDSGAATGLAVTGLPGDIFLRAEGYGLGSKGKILSERFPKALIEAKSILSSYRGRITRPVDLAVMENGERAEYSIESIPANLEPYDVGARTVELISKPFDPAHSVVINGPFGEIERYGGMVSTLGMLEAIAKSGAFLLTTGGHTKWAVDQFRKEYGRLLPLHTDTLGGGAVLSYYSGKDLPAVNAITGGYNATHSAELEAMLRQKAPRVMKSKS